jgi:hypothetical protein
MSRRTMLILRGNAAEAGIFPDAQGKKIAWPFGALHEDAAIAYARRLCYDGVVIQEAGRPQSQTSPQAIATLKKFAEDTTVTAFYGFSGGGYNVRHVLNFLASNQPESLRRIDRIVVLGSPGKDDEGNPTSTKWMYKPSVFNAIARKKVKPDKWDDVKWDVVYELDPPSSALPKGLPKGMGTHMFGPDVLLAKTLENGDCG